jgi:ketol-acid reductoisomerase
MAKIYTDKDAKLADLKGKTVAIVGYGAQGHAQAQNLRDSGIKVVVAELKGTDNYKLAKQHHFKPVTATEAAKQADFIQILLPDEVQGIVYKKEILPYLQPGDILGFSHGFNIHFKAIVPPKFVDVVMVAPKGPGSLVRDLFVQGAGVPNLVAVYQDHSKKALKTALAYSKAIGGTRAGVIRTTFKEETETDLFGEQAILCGGTTALIKACFETLTKAGYQPEIAYYEVMHELKLIVDLLIVGGMSYMRHVVSNTAEYGDLTRGPRVVDAHTKKELQKILKEIQSGKFAKEWIKEYRSGNKNFNRLRARDKKHPVEVVGRKMRRMMVWMEAKEV